MRKIIPLLMLVVLMVGALTVPLATTVQAAYTPPSSHRLKFNFDHDWKFIKQDVAGAQNVAFDDAAWQNVSLPHTYNDIDHYDTWVTGSGDYGFAGKTWYRKHFKLDAAWTGRKVFVEFEGVRQAGEFYINGQFLGRVENGVGPAGVDISNYVNFGATDNVLAVKVDNSLGYKEVATGVHFIWDTPPFLPMYGGIVKNAFLHVTDKVYQTLPLYSNLGTSGPYVYADAINVGAKTANVTAQTEVINANTTAQSVSFEAVVVDRDGNAVLTRTAGAQTINAGQKATFSVNGSLSSIHMWAPDYPYLYTVYTILKIGGTPVDVVATPLGIRTVTWTLAEGLKINGRPLYLKGYAPRSTMEWPNIGQAPNWVEEYDLLLMKQSNANFIRPMHVAPKRADVEAADKLGIIYAVPAGDAEGDNTGREWEQRVELMRDVTIYFRNNPSVIFWEAGNQHITPAHMTEMKAMNDRWDPNGGRFSGTRSNAEDLWSISEYLGSMDNPATSATHPIWDAEYCRTESPRRVWDKYSPPSFGYRNIADPANTIVEWPSSGFLINSSEDLARNNMWDYYRRWSRRGGQGLSSITVGGAKIIWADSVSHGRMTRTEVARVTGAVDGARLPKETFYALQAAHSEKPIVNIMGHWNYPAGTVKNVYVMANTEQVRLITYNTSGAVIRDYGLGTHETVSNLAVQLEFAFANVQWQPGRIRAIGYNGGVQVAQQEIVTAGPAARIRLTPIVGPQGFRADGSDIAMFDVEVTDSSGLRVPLDEARIDFTYSGPATFLGGYNSGIQNSIFKNYLNTEAGINRVFVRASRTPGTFTLTASRAGLQSATVSITSTAFDNPNGLTTVMPQGYTVTLGQEPGDVTITPPPTTPPATTPPPTTPPPSSGDVVMTDFQYTGTDGSRLNPPMPLAHVEHNAQAGRQVYVDSSATFPTLPSYLVGGDYIQAFLRDAPDSSSTDLYQFFTAKYSTIYQLIDAANAMPTHNNNATYQWTRLPETVVINGRTHTIYKSRLMAPGENGYFASNGYGITLAPGSNLYVVFAVSAERQLQTPGQPATASTTQAGNVASNVLDGNTGTRWSAADGIYPQWIRIDLGAKYKIGGYEINWYNSASRAYRYKIELSDNDSTYSLSVDKQANTTVGVSQDRTTSTGAREGRYVRITVTGSSAGWASINDIKVFGADFDMPPTTPPPTTPPPTTPPPTTPPPTTPPPTTPPPTTPPPTTPPPSGNLALNKPVTCTSEQAGNEAAKMVDGSTTTRWAGSPWPQTCQVDLGASYSLNRSELMPYASRAYQYRIEVSNNGTSYTMVVDRSANTSGSATLTDSFAAVSARYVRLVVTGASGYTGGWSSFYEFRIFGGTPPTTPPPTTPPPTTPPPTGNLALGKAVTCSSVENAGMACANAVDGSTGTRWSSAFSDPQWIYVDLGSAASVSRVVLRWEAAYGRAYQIQTSNDAATWTTIYTTTTGDGGIDDLAVSGSGRYIRMYGTTRATGYGYSLWEFEVYSQ